MVTTSADTSVVTRELSPAFHNVAGEMLEVSCSFPSLNQYAIRIDQHEMKTGKYFHYYEVALVSGHPTALGVGLGTVDHPLDGSCQPGWNKNSIGVHSDDGTAFLEGEPTFRFCEPWIPEYTIIGIGIEKDGTVFMTKNGALVGTITRLVGGLVLFPVVAISDVDRRSVQFRFNLKGPFEFPVGSTRQYDSSSQTMLASFGAGSQGQLGRGSYQAEEVPRQIRLDAPSSIAGTSCGRDHSIFFSRDGSVFGCGSNSDGQLGLPEPSNYCEPTRLEGLGNVSLVSAGSKHSAFVVDSDRLFLLGRCGEDGPLLTVPTEVSSHSDRLPIKKVISNELTTFLLFENGTVSTVQLIRGDLSLKRLSSVSGVVDIAPLDTKIVALDREGGLLVIDRGTAAKLDLPVSFSALAGSEGHFAAYSPDKNEVWSWNSGQLEVESLSRKQAIEWRAQTFSDAKPAVLQDMRLRIISVPAGHRVKSLAVGWKSLFVITDRDLVFGLGDGRFNGLGTTELFTLRALSLPEHSVPMAISAGPLHALLTLKEGSLPWRLNPSVEALPHWESLPGSAEARLIELQPPQFLTTPLVAEYEEAISLFRRCDGSDKFKVEKIFLVGNSNLESAFEAEIKKMAHKHKTAPQTFSRQDWKQDESPLRHSAHRRFLERCDHFHWNSGRTHPVLPVLHGTTTAAARAISAGGFSSLSKRDDGQYGRGIYVTTSASYSAQYAPAEPNKTSKTLILSFALPGNIYPISEHPNSPGSLKGAPLKPGHQSHFVRVNRTGAPSHNGHADELVLFQESQLLPRYIFMVSEVPVEPQSVPPPRSESDQLDLDEIKRQLGAVLATPQGLTYFERRKLNSLLAVSSRRPSQSDKQFLLTLFKRLDLPQIKAAEVQSQEEDSDCEDFKESGQDGEGPTMSPPPLEPQTHKVELQSVAELQRRLEKVELENAQLREALKNFETRLSRLEVQ